MEKSKSKKKQTTLPEIDFLVDEDELSGTFPLTKSENVFSPPQKIPAKKPNRISKTIAQNDWLSFDSKHLEKGQDRLMREIAISRHQDPIWQEIERELFYKLFLYNPQEYICGIRTLARLYRHYSKDPLWVKTCGTSQQWVNCEWKKLFYEFKIASQDIPQEALSEFTCRRCKRKGKVSIRREQIKSKDEGETIFYTCHEQSCGATWKE